MANKGKRATEETTPLMAALRLADRVAESRSSIPILSYCLLSSDGKSLKVIANDLDIEIETAVPLSGKPFTAAVSCSALCDAVSFAGGVATFQADKGHLVVGDAPTFRFPTLPADDFPRLKHFDETAFSMPSSELVESLRATTPAMSREETRYYLNGTLIHIKDGKLRFVATDGHRLHIVSRDPPGGATGIGDSIVPRKAVALIIRAIEECPEGERVSMTFGDKHASFTVGNTVIRTKLIDGTYPDIDRVVPSKSEGSWKADDAHLLAAAGAAQALVGRRDKAYLALDFKDGKARTVSPERGTVEQALEGAVTGTPPEVVGVNAAYLADICKAWPAVTFNVEFVDHASPILFRAENPAFFAVLMPVRL